MANANLHGFGVGQFGVAQIKLGARRFHQYENARRKILQNPANLAQFNAAPNQNLPLKTANDRKWEERARYVEKLKKLPVLILYCGHQNP